MSLLFYRRPDYVEPVKGPLNVSDCQKFVERTKGNKSAIPAELSFDNVVQNKTLPPCSLQDFMDYLVYVAHDAENLQFYLWLQDYTRRFDALRNEEKALSKEWKAADAGTGVFEREHAKSIQSPVSTQAEFGLDRDLKSPTIALNDLASPTKSAFPERALSPTRSVTDYESFISGTTRSQRSHAEIAEEATTQAGLKWQPFTAQPFRSEIARVISHYIAQGGPRELNLSHKDRTAVLHALQHTTHPSAFTVISKLVEATLRGQSHPNFIRWGICNGNKPRVFMVRSATFSTLLLGLGAMVLLTLSHVSRWYRIIPAVNVFIGLSGLIAAYKGLCMILHHTHNRTVHPWESYEPSIQSNGTKQLDDEEATLAQSDAHSFTPSTHTDRTGNRNAARRTFDDSSTVRPSSMSTFGTSNTSYTNEPWVAQYSRKPLLRKIFERTTWVQDESVRVIQDRIVVQSQVLAAIVTVVVTVVFVALPKGNVF